MISDLYDASLARNIKFSVFDLDLGRKTTLQGEGQKEFGRQFVFRRTANCFSKNLSNQIVQNQKKEFRNVEKF